MPGFADVREERILGTHVGQSPARARESMLKFAAHRATLEGMLEAKDKRLAPREPVHLVTEIELDGQQVGCGVSRDASGSGLLLLTHLDLPQGSEVALRLYVPGEAHARLLKASVVRSERIPPVEGLVWDYRFAVAFHDPPTDLQQLVHNLTKRSSTTPPVL